MSVLTIAQTPRSVDGIQTAAPVLEFRCLYTSDVRRKKKRWQDGRLKYHMFNKRVMVYDDRSNFVGDTHWREDCAISEGEKVELERNGILVQVSECVGKTEQDLTELLDKPTKEKEARAAARHGFSSPIAASRVSNSQMSDSPLLQRSPGLHSGLQWQGQPIRKQPLLQQSPLQVTRIPSISRPSNHEPPAKRRRFEISPLAKNGYAQNLTGAVLSLSGSQQMVAAQRRGLVQEPVPKPKRVPTATAEKENDRHNIIVDFPNNRDIEALRFSDPLVPASPRSVSRASQMKTKAPVITRYLNSKPEVPPIMTATIKLPGKASSKTLRDESQSNSKIQEHSDKAVSKPPSNPLRLKSRPKRSLLCTSNLLDRSSYAHTATTVTSTRLEVPTGVEIHDLDSVRSRGPSGRPSTDSTDSSDEGDRIEWVESSRSPIRKKLSVGGAPLSRSFEADIDIFSQLERSPHEQQAKQIPHASPGAEKGSTDAVVNMENGTGTEKATMSSDRSSDLTKSALKGSSTKLRHAPETDISCGSETQIMSSPAERGLDHQAIDELLARHRHLEQSKSCQSSDFLAISSLKNPSVDKSLDSRNQEPKSKGEAVLSVSKNPPSKSVEARQDAASKKIGHLLRTQSLPITKLTNPANRERNALSGIRHPTGMSQNLVQLASLMAPPPRALLTRSSSFDGASKPAPVPIEICPSSKDEAALGPWSREAFDLFNWQPPRVNVQDV